MTELPEGWELRRLSDCLEKLKSGKKAERGWSPQCLSHPSVDENVWGVLKTTSVQMGEFQPEYNKELPNSLAPKSGLEVNSGDFLVTTTGPRNRCGIICHVKKTRKRLIFSGKILRFRVNESLILPNWLMYLLMSPEYQNILDKMKVGTSDSSVSIGNQQILDLQIPVAPIDEQHKIVELLEDHLSRLDAALADVKQAKVKAAQFRRSLLQAGLNGFFNNGQKDEVSGLPKNWGIKTLSEVADWTSGGTPSSKDSTFYGGDIPWIVIGDLTEGVVLETEKTITKKGLDSSSAKKLPPGTVMVAMYGASIGRTGVMGKEMTTNQAIACGIPRDEEILGQYLLYFLQSQKNEFIAAGKGGAQPNISQGVVKSWQIPLPPIDEQLQIINEIDSQLEHLAQANSATEILLKESTALRRSLLQAAFTGQLTKEVVSV